MSKLFDDLNAESEAERSRQDRSRPLDPQGLELFAYASKKGDIPERIDPLAASGGPPESKPEAPPPAPPPRPAEPASAPPREVPPVEPPAPRTAETTSDRLLRGVSIRTSKPLYSGLSPLAHVKQFRHERERQWVVRIAAAIGAVALIVLGWAMMDGITKLRHRKAEAPKPSLEKPAAPPVAKAAERKAPPVVPPAPRAPAPAKLPAIVPAGPAPTTPPAAPPAPKAAFRIDVAGSIVRVEGDETVILFEAGLFASGTQLSPWGQKVLAEIARQLAPYRTNLVIHVIGCTDNVRVVPGGKFKDNVELGLLRAAEVAGVMQKAGALQPGQFKKVSYGEQWSPYPNDTPRNKARNRTAVLRLSTR